MLTGSPVPRYLISGHEKFAIFDIHCIPKTSTFLFFKQLCQKLTDFNDFSVCLILRKCDINSFYTFPPHLYTVATLPWKMQKVIFQQYHSYIHVLQIIFVIPDPPQLKMSLHYLVQCTICSSDWRYVAFLQTLVALKKSQLWVGIGGSEKNRLWCVANEMSGKQCYSKCSQWLPSAWIHASSLFRHWSTASSTTLC